MNWPRARNQCHGMQPMCNKQTNKSYVFWGLATVNIVCNFVRDVQCRYAVQKRALFNCKCRAFPMCDFIDGIDYLAAECGQGYLSVGLKLLPGFKSAFSIRSFWSLYCPKTAAHAAGSGTFTPVTLSSSFVGEFSQSNARVPSTSPSSTKSSRKKPALSKVASAIDCPLRASSDSIGLPLRSAETRIMSLSPSSL